METTKNLTLVLRQFILETSKLDITSVDYEDEVVEGPSKTSPDNGKTLTSASFVINADDDTPSGVPCRRRWRITVEMVEDSRADDKCYETR